ncbi:hypothetical protein M3Y94_00406700 [Aphelenchoides besseyi]|nr:hypothetical protein M3Y94_00406700 [Aphelenchoides besseyi]KAI6217784.1 hypothetical protein M3Y95_01197000 [Aphelenchoides besseyi]
MSRNKCFRVKSGLRVLKDKPTKRYQDDDDDDFWSSSTSSNRTSLKNDSSIATSKSSKKSKTTKSKKLICCRHGAPCYAAKLQRVEEEAKVISTTDDESTEQFSVSKPSINKPIVEKKEERPIRNVRAIDDLNNFDGYVVITAMDEDQSTDEQKVKNKDVSGSKRKSKKKSNQLVSSQSSKSPSTELRPRYEKYRVERPLDPFMHYYIGILTRADAELRCTKPAAFAVYHRLPSRLTTYDNLQPRLNLYVVYCTSCKEYRHYPIKTRYVNAKSKLGSRESQCQMYVKLPDNSAPYFQSLKALVRYYATYSYFKSPLKNGQPDIFPWWLQSSRASNTKNNNKSASELSTSDRVFF